MNVPDVDLHFLGIIVDGENQAKAEGGLVVAFVGNEGVSGITIGAWCFLEVEIGGAGSAEVDHPQLLVPCKHE